MCSFEKAYADLFVSLNYLTAICCMCAYLLFFLHNSNPTVVLNIFYSLLLRSVTDRQKVVAPLVLLHSFIHL